MPAIISELIPTISHLDTWSWVLEVGILISNFAVWGGVWLEDEKFSEKTQKFGWKLLLIGLITESALGIFLFAVDTEIKSQQEVEIQSAKQGTVNAINDAIINETRLLEAWRESARDHLALQQMAKAVFPRGFTQDQFNQLTKTLKGKGPINLVVAATPENWNFSLQFLFLFKAAGIQYQEYFVPDVSFVPVKHGENPLPFFNQGVTVYSPHNKFDWIAFALWKIADLPAGVDPFLSPNLKGVPTNIPCIIIGDNDAAFQPWPGQPGEGLDQFGLPVPAP